MSNVMNHYGFADGASRHTRNLDSAAWVLHYPSDQLLVSRGVCIGPASNNVAEYTAVIYLLLEAISLGVDSLVVFLDSQLVVSQFIGFEINFYSGCFLGYVCYKDHFNFQHSFIFLEQTIGWQNH